MVQDVSLKEVRTCQVQITLLTYFIVRSITHIVIMYACRLKNRLKNIFMFSTTNVIHNGTVNHFFIRNHFYFSLSVSVMCNDTHMDISVTPYDSRGESSFLGVIYVSGSTTFSYSTPCKSIPPTTSTLFSVAYDGIDNGPCSGVTPVRATMVTMALCHKID